MSRTTPSADSSSELSHVMSAGDSVRDATNLRI